MSLFNRRSFDQFSSQIYFVSFVSSMKFLQHFRLEKIVTNKSEEQGLNENFKIIKIVCNLFKKIVFLVLKLPWI